MRAAIYVRVSTEEQARGGVSLDFQEERYRDAAIKAGAELIEVFRDPGYSGSNLNRPTIQQLLQRLDEFDLLVVWKLDRLSRSVRDWSNLMHTLAEKQVGFVSVSEQFDFASPWGKAALNMLATFSELFLDILRSNVRAALHHLAHQGRRPAGSAYGYRRENKRMVIVRDEAAVVRRVFREFNEGASLVELARRLNRDGVPCRRGGKYWRVNMVERILTNPMYIGQFIYGGELFEGDHEPIVGEDEFYHAQRRIQLRRKGPRNSRSRFTALFRCGLCGAPVRRQTGAGKGTTCTTWYVPAIFTPPEQRHQRITIAEQECLAVVWRHTEILLSERAVHEALRHSAKKHSGTREREILGRIRELERQIHVNIEAAQRGALPMDMLVQENEPLVAERDSLRDELHAQDRQQPEIAVLRSLLKGKPEQLLRRWRDNAGPEEQLHFLLSLYSRVDIFKGRLVFHYAGDILPPAERPLPRYYSPRRGTPLGF
ncbi:MAG: recombinase family protein [Armatimonadetes bacterium]|nr:recombinase family protein [Armatimonadota bacterium]